MKIAVPVVDRKLCMHFGHCEAFIFFAIDEESKIILGEEELTPPPHEPGVLPKWIFEQGASLVLAGGMGQQAKNILNKNGVEVVVGVSESDPNKAVLSYLNNTLNTAKNSCDH